MYVTKRGNKFRAWERVVIDGVPKRISVTMDKDTPQARKKAAEALKKRMLKPDSSMRYDELVEAYITYQKATLKMSTWTRNQASLKRLSDTFGNARISDMTAGFITNRLLTKTTEPATFNEYLKRLKAMFRWAYRSDYIESAACVDKIRPLKDTPERVKVSEKFLEACELQKILDAAPEFYSAVFGFLALSGLRIGELIALEDEDVTETDIIVKATYDHLNNVLNTPKTSASWRYVHIQPELSLYVNELRKLSNLHRMVSGVRASYFVVNRYGRRLSYVKTANTFKTLCARLTGKELSLHALRHTHVALMAENGADMEMIARRCGHSSSKITKEIYYHVTEKQREKDNAQLDKISLLKQKVIPM